MNSFFEKIKFKIKMRRIRGVEKKYLIGSVFVFFILVFGVVFIPKVFARPVDHVEVVSESLNYEEKDPGSWKVNKSAKWIGRGEAEITFDVDTVMKQKKGMWMYY